MHFCTAKHNLTPHLCPLYSELLNSTQYWDPFNNLHEKKQKTWVCLFTSKWNMDFAWLSYYSGSSKCWWKSVKPWMTAKTHKWWPVNHHVSRFPYRFQKTACHLSVSMLPCSALALQLSYSSSEWGLSFHMATYQESSHSRSALSVIEEEEQGEKIWHTGWRHMQQPCKPVSL